MSETTPSVETLEKQLRVLQRKLERSEWHRVDLENQHDRDQHLYRRLQTDLEAAQREAEIQLALERVRARAMAMRSSEELLEVMFTLRREYAGLGLECGAFWHTHYTPEVYQKALTGIDGHKVAAIMELPRDFASHPALAAWERGDEPIGVFPFDTEAACEYLRHMVTQGKFQEVDPEAITEAMVRANDGWTFVQARTSHGEIGYSLWGETEPSEEAQAVLVRFAAAFDLAYRRFLDLKQAEAQAREAQIEAALERVRGRAMAMRGSDELREMVLVILNEMKALAFPSGRCTIVLFDRETGDSDFWMSGLTDDALPERYHVPYHELPTYKALYDGWRLGTPFFEIELAGEVKREQDRFFHEETEFGRLPEPAKEGMRRFGDIWLSNAATTHGVVQAVGPAPLSDENAAILRRFAKVIDLTYTRVEDIQQSEAQVREAQIEAALERVRSRTIGMQSSDELAEISLVVDQEVRALGTKTWGCAFNIYGEGESTEWFGSEAGVKRPYTTPREEFFLRFYEKGQEGETFHIEAFKGDDCAAHYEYMLTLPVLGDMLAEMEAAGRAFPTSQIDHVAYFKYGYLLFITLEPAPEAHDIFLRFAKVFEQTYTRFLDLKQAEEQAREAEVELALERVRARTMAMQQSTEIGEVALVLYEQLQNLGAELWGTGFAFCTPASDADEFWFVNPGGILPPVSIPHTDDAVHRAMYDGWREGRTLYSDEAGGEELEAHYAYMLTVPDVRGFFQGMLDAGLSFPTWQKWHAAYFSQGYLLVITLEPFEEERIFPRFAKAFEQAYVRFLDLQKAEEQAREARIETALERVRSRTMGMHQSEELKDVIRIVNNQIVDIGLHVDHAGFIIDYNNREDMHIYLADPNEVASEVTIPYFDSAHFNSFREAKRNGTQVFTNELDFEEKNDFYEQLFDLIPGVPDEAKEFYRQCPALSISTVLLDNVGLYVENFSGRPYTDEDNETLLRFGKVFQQAYTRFLDLQRAEEQAREAQIEAALERVRGRAMAMHRSDELGDVAVVLFGELEALEIPMLRCGIGIVDEEADEGAGHIAVRAATEDGGAGSLRVVGSLPLRGLPHVEEMVDAWRAGAATYTYDLTGEALERHREVLVARFDMPREAIIPERQVTLACPFPAGFLFVTGNGPLSGAEAHVARRLTDVFAFAYARFEELQSAEARAHQAEQQASLDRVRAEVASMRTAADLEHVTPLVWRELTALGVPFFRCGVFIVDEATETAEAFLTTPGGEPLAALRLPFGALPTLDAAIGRWREGRGHTDEWDHQQYEAWTQALIDEGLLLPAEDAPDTAEPPETLALHFAPFEQGMLYVGSASPLATDEVASVGALADAFAVAYARYEDFQRLEAKNREVEEAMDELRAAQARLVQSEKMASLGALTAGIAHEIKNPLNFVNNFAALSQELVDELAEEADPEERAALLADLKQNAAKIEEHGRRADGIVRAMMEHARSGSGPHRPVALNTLVAEHAAHAEHAMRVRYPDFEARLDLRLADDVGEVTMEPQEIGRVLVNLVDNALDATRQCAEAGSNGYAPTVTVSTRRTEDSVEVRVADNGPGLAPEVAAKVFEPFFTTKPAGQGTGLGLSLSHDIVAQGHGGILVVESVEGEGAAFVVSLPAPRSEAGVSGRASP